MYLCCNRSFASFFALLQHVLALPNVEISYGADEDSNNETDEDSECEYDDASDDEYDEDSENESEYAPRMYLLSANNWRSMMMRLHAIVVAGANPFPEPRNCLRVPQRIKQLRRIMIQILAIIVTKNSEPSMH
jgi:hypothetical protein